MAGIQGELDNKTIPTPGNLIEHPDKGEGEGRGGEGRGGEGNWMLFSGSSKSFM